MMAKLATGEEVVLAASGHVWVGDRCYLPGYVPGQVEPIDDSPSSAFDAAEMNARFGLGPELTF